ncbi:Poly polymerase 1 [Oopsacas minuta]|uniref:Poly [ADP-ribose] polymerase n=1 Tax=Oopsacas minuta TaxID=111878 RepID=A0AAV7KKB8_9METZ|nr:Poly polymerase 1 [Oopsacas minuta]
MFGKGLYFADMASKSANYCRTTPSNPTGLMLLCEVALGNMYELTGSKYIQKLPAGFHSTKGIGRTAPDISGLRTTPEGVDIPMGVATSSYTGSSSLLYNEFIVYDEAQVKMCYLLKIDFQYKSGNIWGTTYSKVPGKFFPLEIDYGDEDEPTFADAGSKSKLDPAIQSIIRMIFDVQAMKQSLLEMEIDLNKMPLGKLSKNQIKEAYSALKELETLINSGSDATTHKGRFLDLSNKFYTLIPHDFGLESPPLLVNAEVIKEKSEMLDSLLELEVTYSLLSGGKKEQEETDPIDVYYEKLKADLTVVDKKSDEFDMIKEFISNTHGSTHSSFDLKLLETLIYHVQLKVSYFIGSLHPCPDCKSETLIYSPKGYYVCKGALSEWSKCIYTTKEPKRKKFHIPEEVKEIPEIKSMKLSYSVGQRIFPKLTASAPSASSSLGSQEAMETETSQPLNGFSVCIVGKLERTKGELTAELTSLGAVVVDSVSQQTTIVLSNPNEVTKKSAKIKTAEKHSIPILSVSFLEESKTGDALSKVLTNKISDWGAVPQMLTKSGVFKSSAKSEKSIPKMAKMTVKGGGAVDPDSGHEHDCHIYKQGDVIYSATLGMVDLFNGMNSYYKLQLLEHDTKKKYYIFRAWGRVGTNVGNSKLEDFFSLPKAVNEFAAKYLEKTAEMNIKTDADYEEFLELDYLPNIVRGCSSLYGHASIHTFLKVNELHGIIRAHQSKDLGYMTHYKDTWHKPYYYPMVITVFSAPNYVGTHGNLAAFLHFKADTSGIEIIQFDAKQTARIDLAPNPKGERFSFPPIQAKTPLNVAKKSVTTKEFTDDSDVFEFSGLPLRQRISTAPVNSKFKRKSISLLQQGTLGEQGSEKFRLAMSTSIECEKHPGWNSIRRATLAVVKFKTSPMKKVKKSASVHTSGIIASSTKCSDDDTLNPATNFTTPKAQASGDNSGDGGGSTPSFPRSTSENTPIVFSRARSSNMDPEDDQQIRILFDTIDKNGDGKITRKEFSNFLYNIEEYNFNQGHELFNKIDINSDGSVDFTEFCSYISTLELLPEESITAIDD